MSEFKIGRLFGGDLIIRFDNEQPTEEHLDKIKSKLSLCQYIYFDGYEGGHHPDFFKHYPELKNYESN